MDSGLGKDSRDFRRLLLGIPSIVHGVSRDPVTELERKYKEAENTCIHDMVHAANLSPEQLAILIEQSRRSVPNGDPEMIFDQSEEETEE